MYTKMGPNGNLGEPKKSTNKLTDDQTNDNNIATIPAHLAVKFEVDQLNFLKKFEVQKPTPDRQKVKWTPGRWIISYRQIVWNVTKKTSARSN